MEMSGSRWGRTSISVEPAKMNGLPTQHEQRLFSRGVFGGANNIISEEDIFRSILQREEGAPV